MGGLLLTQSQGRVGGITAQLLGCAATLPSPRAWLAPAQGEAPCSAPSQARSALPSEQKRTEKRLTASPRGWTPGWRAGQGLAWAGVGQNQPAKRCISQVRPAMSKQLLSPSPARCWDTWLLPLLPCYSTANLYFSPAGRGNQPKLRGLQGPAGDTLILPEPPGTGAATLSSARQLQKPPLTGAFQSLFQQCFALKRVIEGLARLKGGGPRNGSSPHMGEG